MISQFDFFFLLLWVKFLGKNTVVQQHLITPLVDRHRTYLTFQRLLLIHCKSPDHILTVVTEGELVEVIFLKFVSLLWK